MGIFQSIKEYIGFGTKTPEPIGNVVVVIDPAPVINTNSISIDKPITEEPEIRKIRKSLDKDRKKVSLQKHEIDFIAKKYSVKPAVVRKVISEVGNSRRKIYAVLNKL